MRVENFRTIIVVQLIAIMALAFLTPLMERGTDKDVVRGVGIGLMISLLIQFILFRFKANWFDEKVKKHPHQA